jgi:hypothetical protein
MKDNSWNDELLDDVLAADATPSLRTDSLAQMLGAVQRRRQQRQQARAILATTCFVALIGLALRFVPARPSSTRVGAAFQVSSHPLAPGVIVATHSGAIEMVGSARESVPLVEPLSAGDLFEFIGDDKLLALLEGRPAGLVHRDGSSSELVFLNPKDADGFQVR